MIKSTDRFSAGLAAIAEYKDNPYNPFASDSEDSEKIRQTENRALAKKTKKAH